MGGDYRPQRPREPDSTLQGRTRHVGSSAHVATARRASRDIVGALVSRQIRLSFRPSRVTCLFTTRERRRVSDTALQPTIARPTRSQSSWRDVVRLAARASLIAAVAVILVQVLHTIGLLEMGFSSWRPVAIVVLLWFIIFDVSVYVTGGVKCQQFLFLLPALQITLSLV